MTATVEGATLSRHTVASIPAAAYLEALRTDDITINMLGALARDLPEAKRALGMYCDRLFAPVRAELGRRAVMS